MNPLLVRSFNTAKLLRPRPLVTEQDAHGLRVILTPWSGGDLVPGATDAILACWEDRDPAEQTVARDRHVSVKTQLQQLEARLVETLRESSKEHFRALNSQKVTTLFEVFVMLETEHWVVWASIGKPDIYHYQSNRVHLLSYLSNGDMFIQKSAPLPTRFWGQGEDPLVQSGVVPKSDDSQLLLVSSSEVLTHLLSGKVTPGAIDVGEVHQFLVKNYAEQPFWLGQLSLCRAL